MLPIIASINVLGQSAPFSLTDLCLVIWVAGQVVVQIINAWKGPTVSSKQTTDAITGIQQQVTQLSANQVPPDIMATFIQSMGQFAAIKQQFSGAPARPVPAAPVARPPATTTTTTATVTEKTTQPATSAPGFPFAAGGR